MKKFIVLMHFISGGVAVIIISVLAKIIMGRQTRIIKTTLGVHAISILVAFITSVFQTERIIDRFPKNQ